jgi:mRNA degradation ribonuclease J1/J2
MKKVNKKIFIGIIVLIVLIIGILYVNRINNYIYLTQFGATTSRQMMGYAIKTKNNKIVIIDGGTKEDSTQLEEYIKENGNEVYAWFITHPHTDHAGAFEVISQNSDIRIDQIYMSINEENWYLENEPSRSQDINDFFEIIENENIKDKITEPQINDTIKIDNIIVKILGIKNPEITTNAINNSSMVMKIKVNNKKILFLGDTGTESSEKLIKNQGNNLKADIVQMAHHGQAGATEDLYKIVNPEICLWPTPEWLWNNNSNGTEDSGPWKTKETRKWMENLKVKQNYIEKDGTQNIKIF